MMHRKLNGGCTLISEFHMRPESLSLCTGRLFFRFLLLFRFVLYSAFHNILYRGSLGPAKGDSVTMMVDYNHQKICRMRFC